MYKIKVLEFDYVLLAGINKGIIPLRNILSDITDKTIMRERLT